MLVTHATAQTASESRQATVAQIKKLGGHVRHDENDPGKPVVSVEFSNPAFTDAEMVHLKGLTNLRELSLRGTKVTDTGLGHLKGMALTSLDLLFTPVSDAGLEHLKGMTSLQTLVLTETRVTDAGLKHLTGLTRLGYLGLNATKVSDAGIEHLKELKSLRTLTLRGTHVTDTGVRELHSALPNCHISK